MRTRGGTPCLGFHQTWAFCRIGLVLLLCLPFRVQCWKGVLSVDAWCATALDVEEVLSEGRPGDLHIFLADVVKSFDTVDRDIPECPR